MSKAKQVETHFNKTFKEFDDIYNPQKGAVARWLDDYFRRSMKLRFQRVLDVIAPYSGKTVLDVGCGAGRYSVALALKGIAKAYGIDFAPNMIDLANARAKELNVHHICSFEKGDFINADIAQTYHHSFAMGVLDYIEDPGPFVKKMKDLTTVSVMISFPSAGGFIQWCRRHVFNKIKKCPVYFYTEEDIARIAQEAGAQSFSIAPMAKDFFLTIQCKED